jgi:fructose-specific phosphotransferase system IIC component
MMERKSISGEIVTSCIWVITLMALLMGFIAGYTCSTLITCNKVREGLRSSETIGFITMEDETMFLKKCECPEEL